MLNGFQREIIRIIIVNRNEASYFGGGSALNYNTHRISDDLDIFHCSSEKCRMAYENDIHTLGSAGYNVETIRKHENPFFAKAKILKDNEQTNIDWVPDSGFRFFPVQKHEELGYVLHQGDLLVNKLLTCASRRAVRDYYDLCLAWHNGLPLLESLVAAPGCDPGYTAETILEGIHFQSRYQVADFEELMFAQKLSPAQYQKMAVWCKNKLIDFTRQAYDAFQRIRIEDLGCFYLKKETMEIFLPTEEDFTKENYIRNQGRNFNPTLIVQEQPTKKERHMGFRLS
jgi:hypothetical protein